MALQWQVASTKRSILHSTEIFTASCIGSRAAVATASFIRTTGALVFNPRDRRRSPPRCTGPSHLLPFHPKAHMQMTSAVSDFTKLLAQAETRTSLQTTEGSRSMEALEEILIQTPALSKCSGATSETQTTWSGTVCAAKTKAEALHHPRPAFR